MWVYLHFRSDERVLKTLLQYASAHKCRTFFDEHRKMVTEVAESHRNDFFEVRNGVWWLRVNCYGRTWVVELEEIKVRTTSLAWRSARRRVMIVVRNCVAVRNILNFISLLWKNIRVLTVNLGVFLVFDLCRNGKLGYHSYDSWFIHDEHVLYLMVFEWSQLQPCSSYWQEISGFGHDLVLITFLWGASGRTRCVRFCREPVQRCKKNGQLLQSRCACIRRQEHHPEARGSRRTAAVRRDQRPRECPRTVAFQRAKRRAHASRGTPRARAEHCYQGVRRFVRLRR